MKSSGRAAVFLFCAVLLSWLICGCGPEDTQPETKEQAAAEEEYVPAPKEDGSPYRIAYIDYDQYLPSTRQLYYIIRALQEKGWLKDTELPFDENTENAMDMLRQLEETDHGEYLSFAVEDSFYIAYEDEEEVKEKLKEDAQAGKIDLFLTSGTNAGLFIKGLDLEVPMLNVASTDPAASGIIESVEDSGSPYIWAQVEPSVPLRQLKYYHEILPFEKLGAVIYGDEIISAVADQEQAAWEVGFERVQYHIEECPRETEEEKETYYSLVKEYYNKLVYEDQIDAYFLTIDLINDLDRMDGLLEVFYQENIPVFLMDDENALKEGGLMLIAAYDFQNIGRFVSETVGMALYGEPLDQIPCVYQSSPYICLNLEVAKKIGFTPDFQFLLSCDRIYGGSGA